jgi:hypothetical protein
VNGRRHRASSGIDVAPGMDGECFYLHIAQCKGHTESMVSIRPMEASDWDAVRSIYLEGIATGNATFETSAPEWDEWDRGHLSACRLVASMDGQVVGWAALIPVSDRCICGGQRLCGGKRAGEGCGTCIDGRSGQSLRA